MDLDDEGSCIARFTLPLTSSNRMKPMSGDWAVTFEFLQEAAITSLSNGSNQFPYYTMEKDPLAVKIEPEDDLENNIQHEETLEIESQFDIPIKSERRLKEVYECQQPEYGQRPTVFSPNKEELEKVLKVELYNNCQTPVYEQNIILLPHFKEEPDMDPDNSNCYDQDQDSCIRHGGSNYSRCEEEEWSKIAQRQDNYIKYGGTYSKRICKEEGCFKCARRGGKCIKHGGIQTKRVCKEEGCSKNALKGDFLIPSVSDDPAEWILDDDTREYLVQHGVMQNLFIHLSFSKRQYVDTTRQGRFEKIICMLFGEDGVHSRMKLIKVVIESLQSYKNAKNYFRVHEKNEYHKHNVFRSRDLIDVMD
ncbi:unnamed protein product, partial [Timema podura]|nr:unnamed protein product [Timema podura]